MIYETSDKRIRLSRSAINHLKNDSLNFQREFSTFVTSQERSCIQSLAKNDLIRREFLDLCLLIESFPHSSSIMLGTIKQDACGENLNRNSQISFDLERYFQNLCSLENQCPNKGEKQLLLECLANNEADYQLFLFRDTFENFEFQEDESLLSLIQQKDYERSLKYILKKQFMNFQDFQDELNKDLGVIVRLLYQSADRYQAMRILDLLNGKNIELPFLSQNENSALEKFNSCLNKDPYPNFLNKTRFELKVEKHAIKSRCVEIPKSRIDPCRSGGSSRDLPTRFDGPPYREGGFEVHPVVIVGDFEINDPGGPNLGMFNGRPSNGGPGEPGVPISSPPSEGESGDTVTEPSEINSREVSLSEARGNENEEELAREYSEAVKEVAEKIADNFLDKLGVVDFKLQENNSYSSESLDDLTSRIKQIVEEANLHAMESGKPLTPEQKRILTEEILNSANRSSPQTEVNGESDHEGQPEIRLTLNRNDLKSPERIKWEKRQRTMREVINDPYRASHGNFRDFLYRSFTDHTFLTRDKEFKSRLRKLKVRVENISPQSNYEENNPFTDGEEYLGIRQKAKEMANQLIVAADQESFLGDQETAEQAYDLALELADIAAGVTPGVSLAKDAYELFSGKNAITGEALDTFDRSIAALGLLTLGGSNLIKGGAKVLAKVGSRIAKSAPNLFKTGFKLAVENGKEIYDSAWKLGASTKQGIANLSDLLRKTLGSEIGATGNLNNLIKLERKAKSLKINFNSPTSKSIVNNLGMKTSDFIGKFRQGSIRREFPAEFLDKSVEEALKNGNSKVRKLLTDGRFLK